MNYSHTIFVPKPGHELGIAPGSALVAGMEQPHKDLAVVYYEGNVYDVPDLRAFAQKLLHAAGRQAVRYPTVARMTIPRQSLIEVGHYDYPSQRIVQVTNAEALQAWIGHEAFAAIPATASA